MSKKKLTLNHSYDKANILIGDKLHFEDNGRQILGKVKAMSQNGMILFVESLQRVGDEPLYHSIDRCQILSWVEHQHHE